MSPARTTTTTSTTLPNSSPTHKHKRSSKATAAPRKLGARARARRHGIDSDDEEMERHATTSEGTGSDVSVTDSEDDDDDDDDDEEDSDVESDAESGLSAGRSHPDTPNTTQSPPPGNGDVVVAALNGKDGNEAAANLKVKGPAVVTDSDVPSFLETTKDWSEMVAQEGENLQVIEFSQMHVHNAAEEEDGDGDGDVTVNESAAQGGKNDAIADSGSRQRSTAPHQRPSRGRGSAHASYQKRLNEDPAFIPRVGGFWGHDDRLYDPELRPLSHWWHKYRGRGGSGRGGRGRGGFVRGDRNAGVANGTTTTGEGGEHAEGNEQERDAPELPPVDRTWTHDGFEEMKSRDERRREQARQERQENGARSPQQWGGRGGFAQRGYGPAHPRGAGRGFARGRGVPFFNHNHNYHQQHVRSQSVQSERTWFVQKPERFWTKQLEGHLFFEYDLRARPGRGTGYRIHLPGKGSKIVHSPVSSNSAKAHSSMAASRTTSDKAPSEVATETDRGSDRKVVVKIPKATKIRDQQANANVKTETIRVSTQESVTTVENPLTSETSTKAVHVREDHTRAVLNAVATTVDEQVQAPSSPPMGSSISPPIQDPIAAQSDIIAMPGSMWNGTLNEQTTVPNVDVVQPAPMVVEAIMGNINNIPSSSTSAAPTIIPPVQPVYSPSHSQPSPTTYGLAYVYADNSALPPGMTAYHHHPHQMPSSAHPIYLQATPPPPPPAPAPAPAGMQLYTPHTHAMGPPPPFVPSHMHHHSLSAVPAEFIPVHQQHSHHAHHHAHTHNLHPHASSFQRYPNAGTPPLVGVSGMGGYGAAAGGGGGGNGGVGGSGSGGVFVDPATGQTLFSLPRQNSRIEIRKPGESAAGEGKKAASYSSPEPSGLGLRLKNGSGVERESGDGDENANESGEGEIVRGEESPALDAAENGGGEFVDDDANATMPSQTHAHAHTPSTDGASALPRYASSAPEFYPRPMSMSMSMPVSMQMSMPMPMMAPPYGEEGAYQMQSPDAAGMGGMMEYGYGYAYAPQGYYYPEAYYAATAAGPGPGPGAGYAPQQQQQQGAYDPYAQDLQPVYY